MTEDIVDRVLSDVDVLELSQDQSERKARIDSQVRRQIVDISVDERVRLVDAHDWEMDDRFNSPFRAMAALGADILEEPIREGLIDACLYVVRNHVERKVEKTDSKSMADNNSRDTSRTFDPRRTGLTIDDCVEDVVKLGDDPEAQYYYTTYSDVFQTSPRCPHIQDSEALHVAGTRTSLNGPLQAGAHRVVGSSDEYCDLSECNWCEAHGGWHPHEHPDRDRTDNSDNRSS